MIKRIKNNNKKAALKAEELISYAMPAYKLNSVLVYFAGYKKHICFYATPNGHKTFLKNFLNTNREKALYNFLLIPHFQ